MPIKLYIYAAVVIVVLGLSGTVMLYKAKAETSKIKQQVAEKQRDTMLEINQSIIEATAKDAELRSQLYEEFKGARDESEQFKQKLAEHDLSALAAAKPDTLTRLARAATERVLRDIETAANGRSAEEVPESSSSGHSETEASPANSDDN